MTQKQTQIKKDSWILWSILSKREILIFSIVTIICATAFTFVYDLWHTSQCSFGYIKGHFLDFYEYNTSIGVGTIVYYPTIYIIYALWNLPLYLLGVDSINIRVPGILLYEKILGYVFLVFMYILVYHISQRVFSDKKRALSVVTILLTIPYFFLVSFPWGLYDSVHVTLVLLGIYLLMKNTKKDAIIAILMFSIASSCKTMVLFIIFPILFYRFKKIWQLILSLVGTFGVLGVEILIYKDSPIFKNSVLSPLNSFVDTLFGFSFSGVSFYLASLIILCIVAFRLDYDNNNLLPYIWLPFASGALFIAMTSFNPNWVFLFMPYYAILIASLPIKDRKLFYLLNLCLSFVCIGRVVGHWNHNFSEPTFAAGLFGKLLLDNSLYTSDAGFLLIKASNYFTEFFFRDSFYRFFVTVIGAILFYAVYFLNPWSRKVDDKPADIMGKEEKKYVYSCFLIGISLYIIPIALWVIRHSKWS